MKVIRSRNALEFILGPVAHSSTCLYFAFFQYVFDNRQRRERVGPTRIKGDVRDDFRCLRLREPIIQRTIQGETCPKLLLT